jgi:hypothetical protein
MLYTVLMMRAFFVPFLDKFPLFPHTPFVGLAHFFLRKWLIYNLLTGWVCMRTLNCNSEMKYSFCYIFPLFGQIDQFIDLYNYADACNVIASESGDSKPHGCCFFFGSPNLTFQFQVN